MTKQPCVYIMAGRRNGTLYTGVTSDLLKRVWEHKNNAVEGSTERYGVHHLVWYEPHETMESAIQREKNIKKWRRGWKLALIEGSSGFPVGKIMGLLGTRASRPQIFLWRWKSASPPAVRIIRPSPDFVRCIPPSPENASHRE